MELTVVGCWAPYPRAGEACSCYLVRGRQATLILDCGHAAFSVLQRYADFRTIDAVVITHFHPDHYVDLYALRHALRGARFLGSRTEPVRLLLPPGPEAMVEYWRQTEEFVVERCEGPVAVGDLVLHFHPVPHAVPALLVAVSQGRRRLVYSGDTDYAPPALQPAQGADLLLAEASLLDFDREYARRAMHLTAREAGRWAAESGVGRLVVTHFWPEYEVEDVMAEVRAEYGGPVLAAREGLRVEV
ncbi:MAG: MBL fold metallo-hydrolase [Syntrophomonadaceae bacterium]|nr:MBL fold metallo-hydrolase [Syntrophomonadaceae bacterium]MDH7498718.1 MBL fold metallo-hydrolase [Syntrophomonadaceae bacterium]